jgi:predicted O-linked N-acetylglucosamine transferase (SPINDLY family)
MLNWLKRNFADNPELTPSSVTISSDGKFSAQLNSQDDCINCKNSGDLHLDQGEFEKAAECYRQAIACNPVYAEAYNNLGNTCSELGLYEEAERFLKQALSINPDLVNVYYNLATLQLDQNRLDEAIENFSETIKREPEFHVARGLLLFQLQKICKWDDLNTSIQILRNAAMAPTGSSIGIFSPFTFLSIPGATAEEHKRCAERLVHSEYKSSGSVTEKSGFKFKKKNSGKISVAYISADFRQHPVSYLLAQMFELHDRSLFNITAYSCGPEEHSAIRMRLENAFDNFFNIRNYSDEDAAKKIYADNIDILVDLTGHTRDNRCGILALRPAPIQVNFLGYPGTMGADFVDYLIADPFVIPPEHQKYYAETVVRMPHCFMPGDRTRSRPPAPKRKDCELPEKGFVFCCFNQTYKITPEVFDVWCRLLKAVPGSILWLSASSHQAEDNLRREAESRGVSATRIFMAAKLPNVADHLARLQCADLFLDTIPYNAHATCSDALWMGLPVITCTGETFPSRVAGSLLTAIGTPELITYSREDYYILALELANNNKKLEAIRNAIISNRDTAPLFDSVRFTRDLEKLYLQMMDSLPKIAFSRRLLN